MGWCSWKKKECIFVAFVLPEGNFFCVLSQCIVYWMNFQNIYTFTYHKTLLHKLLLFVFKIVENLQFVLKANLLITKSRIIPLKNMAIFLLVLLRKLVLSRLMREVKTVIKKKVEIGGDIFTGQMIHTFIYYV